MTARLVSLNGHADIPLDRPVVLVGRIRQCDVWIDSLPISRLHCCLVLARDEVQVLDLGSTNGTRINGRRIEVGVLRPGDELAIAHLRYSLEFRRADGSLPDAGGRRLHELDTLHDSDIDPASRAAAPTPVVIRRHPPQWAGARPDRCDADPR
jgi:hypothetical protein